MPTEDFIPDPSGNSTAWVGRRGLLCLPAHPGTTSHWHQAGKSSSFLDSRQAVSFGVMEGACEGRKPRALLLRLLGSTNSPRMQPESSELTKHIKEYSVINHFANTTPANLQVKKATDFPALVRGHNRWAGLSILLFIYLE